MAYPLGRTTHTRHGDQWCVRANTLSKFGADGRVVHLCPQLLQSKELFFDEERKVICHDGPPAVSSLGRYLLWSVFRLHENGG